MTHLLQELVPLDAVGVETNPQIIMREENGTIGSENIERPFDPADHDAVLMKCKNSPPGPTKFQQRSLRTFQRLTK